MITSEQLHAVLHYDPETGSFIRISGGRVRRKTGSPQLNGYVAIGIDYRKYYAHRLAWLYVHGRWPNGEIDHINGVRNDNRIANLREATRSENQQNRIGVRGASLHPCGRWIAQIGLNGRIKYIGLFDTEDQASAAYFEAKRKEHPFSTQGITP